MACSGERCTYEKFYFKKADMHDLKLIPTGSTTDEDVPGDPLTLGTGSLAWQQKIGSEYLDPRPPKKGQTQNKEHWEVIDWSDVCESPEENDNCYCRYLTPLTIQHDYATPNIDCIIGGKTFQFEWTSLGYYHTKIGKCVSRFRKVSYNYWERREQLMAMNIADLIEFTKPFTDMPSVSEISSSKSV